MRNSVSKVLLPSVLVLVVLLGSNLQAAKSLDERIAESIAAQKQQSIEEAEYQSKEKEVTEVGVKRIADERAAIEPQMVMIPAGTFTMGCVPSRDNVLSGCDYNEKPAHEVSISAFHMATHEVTFEEWDRCTQAGVCIHAKDEGWGRGNRPVIYVSWNDVQVYIRWLNQQTGSNYRLPTEAEWEYAARAGGNAAFPWGNSINCSQANYGWTSDCRAYRTKPVGSYVANRFGLYDTVGNVWEWTQDWKGLYGSDSIRDPQGASSGSKRVLRGGSWFNFGGQCRSSSRIALDPSIAHTFYGFRLARSR